ncbi:hypothetical protein J0H58_20665 [bacterium]|nr:hypothetical protein [bacterium]
MNRRVMLGAAAVALAGCGKIGSVAVKAVVREGAEAGAGQAVRAAPAAGGKAVVAGGAKAGAKQAGEGGVGGRIGQEAIQQSAQYGVGQLSGDGESSNKKRR